MCERAEKSLRSCQLQMGMGYDKHAETTNGIDQMLGKCVAEKRLRWHSPVKETRGKCSTKSFAFGSRSDHDPNRITAFPSHGRVTPKSQSKSISGHGRVTAFASHRRITAGSSTILYDRLLAVPSCLSCLSFLCTFLVISISTGRFF